ncbi:hypothetical protein ACFL5S_00685 [Fibrobacterota bacterium]
MKCYHLLSKNWTRGKMRLIITLLIGALLPGILHTEEVCKFAYKGQPEDYINDTIVVPDEMVAMSEYLYVGTPIDIVYDTIHQPSIIFVIDHSGSMYQSTGSVDVWGNRFRVTHDLIDTILTHSPYAEVGVAVFNTYLYYDDRDDDIFETISQDTVYSAYIPLLQLNKDYNGRMGYEIIKQYLETDTLRDTTGMSVSNGDTTWIIHKSIGLKYKSPWYDERATHINAGFHAVKKAMQSAQYLPENHFVIFLSDGDASVGEPTADQYIEDVKTGVPTTFTVFFIEQGGQAPQSLITMTTNIQNSNYSTTNPKSNLWEYQNTSYAQLMQFLMENVIQEILKQSVFNPTQIIVNGQQVNNWDTTGFLFPDLFPLLGWTTPFNFTIDYHVIKDTLNEQTGQLDTIEYDTTIIFDFDVEIDPTMGPLSDSLYDVRCWDRDLGFYFNNNLAPVLTEIMNPLEIRFTYNAGAADYTYTKSTVEVSTVGGNAQDRETFTLTQNGTTFSLSFPHSVINDNMSPTAGDGTLQHYVIDTVVAVFRNDEDPKLPLDTLMIRIPTTFAGLVEIDVAEYHDNNADGYVDSIYVTSSTDIAGGLTDIHVQELVQNAISFPAFRGFTANSAGLVANGFYIDVTEDKSHTPFTYITNDDKLEIAEYYFSTGGKIEKKTVSTLDKMAPIIHWEPKSALLADYQVTSKSDTLGVKFSEPVENVTAAEPFYFLDRDNNSNYSVTLLTVSQPKPDSMIFHVVSVSGVAAMEDGDSLWIHETDLVTDTEGNFQNNTGNIKRKLYVEKIYGSIDIAKAYYFDRTADGYVDSIYVEATTEIEGGITATHVSELVASAITFPDFRDFTATGSGLTTGGFYIIVTEDKGHNPFTYVTGDDKLQIRDYTFTTGGTVKAKAVTIYDRIAPIIHWEKKAAFLLDHMIDTISDTLTVKFSEPVERVTSDEPFYFLDRDNNTNYTVRLSDDSQPDPDKMVFYVSDLSGVDYMEEGDSLWIKETDRVSDREGNFQNNYKNTRRKLYVKRIIIPYELIPQSITPVDLTNIHMHVIPDVIIDVLNYQGILSDLHLQQNINGTYSGMLIMVVPDPDNIGKFLPDFELKGDISIFDPVGNQVIARSRMGWWDEKKYLVWAWNMKNENDRTVGSGAYAAVMEVEDVTKSLGYQNGGPKQVKKTLVGVRE